MDWGPDDSAPLVTELGMPQHCVAPIVTTNLPLLNPSTALSAWQGETHAPLTTSNSWLLDLFCFLELLLRTLSSQYLLLLSLLQVVLVVLVFQPLHLPSTRASQLVPGLRFLCSPAPHLAQKINVILRFEKLVVGITLDRAGGRACLTMDGGYLSVVQPGAIIL